jgi:SAM-dependent methyltransferase
MAKRKAKALPVQEVLRLDLGCGKNPREGFEGVDSIDFGQKYVMGLATFVHSPGLQIDPLTDKPYKVTSLGYAQWPWADNSVEEANCSHFIEHLTASERIHFVNELYRVLKPGAKCSVVVPAWSSARAYGDLTHQWPPVSEWWFFYLNKAWRDVNAPHNITYSCNFDCTWGYGMHQAIQARNVEYQQHALTFFKEAAQDIVATFVKN